jgi:hypothetical protein
VVLAADAAAQSAGLRVGMPASKAQALVQPPLLLLARESKHLRVTPAHEAIRADELGLGKAMIATPIT